MSRNRIGDEKGTTHPPNADFDADDESLGDFVESGLLPDPTGNVGGDSYTKLMPIQDDQAKMIRCSNRSLDSILLRKPDGRSRQRCSSQGCSLGCRTRKDGEPFSSSSHHVSSRQQLRLSADKGNSSTSVAPTSKPSYSVSRSADGSRQRLSRDRRLGQHSSTSNLEQSNSSLQSSDSSVSAGGKESRWATSVLQTTTKNTRDLTKSILPMDWKRNIVSSDSNTTSLEKNGVGMRRRLSHELPIENRNRSGNDDPDVPHIRPTRWSTSSQEKKDSYQQRKQEESLASTSDHHAPRPQRRQLSKDRLQGSSSKLHLSPSSPAKHVGVSSRSVSGSMSPASGRTSPVRWQQLARDSLEASGNGLQLPPSNPARHAGVSTSRLVSGSISPVPSLTSPITHRQISRNRLEGAGGRPQLSPTSTTTKQYLRISSRLVISGDALSPTSGHNNPTQRRQLSKDCLAGLSVGQQPSPPSPTKPAADSNGTLSGPLSSISSHSNPIRRRQHSKDRLEGSSDRRQPSPPSPTKQSIDPTGTLSGPLSSISSHSTLIRRRQHSKDRLAGLNDRRQPSPPSPTKHSILDSIGSLVGPPSLPSSQINPIRRRQRSRNRLERSRDELLLPSSSLKHSVASIDSISDPTKHSQSVPSGRSTPGLMSIASSHTKDSVDPNCDDVFQRRRSVSVDKAPRPLERRNHSRSGVRSRSGLQTSRHQPPPPPPPPLLKTVPSLLSSLSGGSSSLQNLVDLLEESQDQTPQQVPAMTKDQDGRRVAGSVKNATWTTTKDDKPVLGDEEKGSFHLDAGGTSRSFALLQDKSIADVQSLLDRRLSDGDLYTRGKKNYYSKGDSTAAGGRGSNGDSEMDFQSIANASWDYGVLAPRVREIRRRRSLTDGP